MSTLASLMDILKLALLIYNAVKGIQDEIKRAEFVKQLEEAFNVAAKTGDTSDIERLIK